MLILIIGYRLLHTELSYLCVSLNIKKHCYIRATHKGNFSYPENLSSYIRATTQKENDNGSVHRETALHLTHYQWARGSSSIAQTNLADTERNKSSVKVLSNLALPVGAVEGGLLKGWAGVIVYIQQLIGCPNKSIVTQQADEGWLLCQCIWDRVAGWHGLQVSDISWVLY